MFADIVNVCVVFCGITLIVKPPFLFGTWDVYSKDPEVIYAVLVMVFGYVLLQANVYVTLRLLKGSQTIKFVSFLHSGMFSKVLFRCENVGRQDDFAPF